MGTDSKPANSIRCIPERFTLVPRLTAPLEQQKNLFPNTDYPQKKILVVVCFPCNLNVYKISPIGLQSLSVRALSDDSRSCYRWELRWNRISNSLHLCWVGKKLGNCSSAYEKSWAEKQSKSPYSLKTTTQSSTQLWEIINGCLSKWKLKMHFKEKGVNTVAFYASWVNFTTLDFAVVWIFIVNISSVFSIFFHLFASCYMKLCCVLKTWYSRINQIFLLGWFFSLDEQRKNFVPMALNMFPSFLTCSPFNGGEGFSPPNKHLRLNTDREGERMKFLRCLHCRHCSQTHRYTDPQIWSQRRNFFLFQVL